jgi:prepilin-type N-terminal cleavage/methylation domain-containing protein
MKIRKNNRGFTLVELLLVMAIIGILAGVIFVATAPARKKARITTFKQNMKDLATAGSLCIDSGGSIFNVSGAGSVAASGIVPFCDEISSTDTVPAIKVCKGGSDTIDVSVNGDYDNDDYVISANCPVTGTGASAIVCNATCNVNGCYFDDQGTADSTHNNGCPHT